MGGVKGSEARGWAGLRDVRQGMWWAGLRNVRHLKLAARRSFQAKAEGGGEGCAQSWNRGGRLPGERGGGGVPELTEGGRFCKKSMGEEMP